VKGYARHEKGVFDEIGQRAHGMLGRPRRGADKIQAPTNSERESEADLLPRTIQHLQGGRELSERLMDELAGTENSWTVKRERYNERAQYNTDINRIPGACGAKIGGSSPGLLQCGERSESRSQGSFQ